LRVISEEFIRFEDSALLSVVDKYLPCTFRHSPDRAGIWLLRDRRSDFYVKH